MERRLADRRVVGGRAEGVVVGDERVHPVDRDELLGQRVRDRRSGSPPSPGMPLITSLGERRPKRSCSFSPARPHQFARSAIFVVGWLITAGVHSTVWILAISAALIEPRPLEDVVVRPRRVLGSQPVADRVVLADEDDLHQRDPEPEARHLRRVVLLVRRDRQQAVLADPQLAVLARAQELLHLERAAVELRRVPPVRLGVEVRGRELVAVRRPRRVRRRARDLPSASPATGRRPRGGSSTCCSPSPRPWLNQSRIMNWSHGATSAFTDVAGMERVARQQLAADQARARLLQARLGPRGTSARSGRCGRSASRPGPSRGRRGRCASRPASARSGSERRTAAPALRSRSGRLFVS